MSNLRISGFVGQLKNGSAQIKIKLSNGNEKSISDRTLKLAMAQTRGYLKGKGVS